MVNNINPIEGELMIECNPMMKCLRDVRPIRPIRMDAKLWKIRSNRCKVLGKTIKLTSQIRSSKLTLPLEQDAVTSVIFLNRRIPLISHIQEKYFDRHWTILLRKLIARDSEMTPTAFVFRLEDAEVPLTSVSPNNMGCENSIAFNMSSYDRFL